MGCRDYSPRAMTKTLALAVLTAALLAAPGASAQMYPGEGITVNSQAPAFYASGPRGPYAGVIHLKPPGAKHAVRHHHAAKKSGPSSAEVGDALMAAQAAPEQTAPPKPKHRKSVETVPEAPADSSADGGGIPLSLAPGEPNPPQSNTSGKAKVQKQASIAPTQATTTANIVPAQQAPGATGNLAKRSEILFARNATDPGNATINKLHGIANELNTLLGAGAARVQLDAYGGPPGDKSSDSRRLSLKRALVIRQILIEDGVPSERIDVRALGGIDDHGAPDRVDVYVSAS